MTWLESLEARVDRLGHRNWILIADAAYPEYASPGVTTLTTTDTLDAAVAETLDLLTQWGHVRPVACLDAELDWLDDLDAPGVGDLRRRLERTLADCEVERWAHETILERVQEDSRKFAVIVVKTSCMIPYTSVFLRLECGYWSAEAERGLRERERR